MIYSILSNKIKFFLKEYKNPWKLVLSLFLIFTSWAYGRLFGEIYSKALNGEIDFITPEKLKALLLILIVVITTGRMVFPVYKPLKQSLPGYYPLSKFNRYLSSVIIEFISPFFLYFSIFLITCSFFISDQCLGFLITGFVTMFSSQLLRHIIQLLVEYKFNTINRFIYITILAVTIFGLIKIPIFNIYTLLIISCVAVLLFFLGFVLTNSLKERKNYIVTQKILFNSTILKILFNNKKVRLPIIIGFIFKIAILIINLITYKTNGKYLLDSRFLILLLSSPLIIFTYVFNNTWGYWKSLWFNIELRSGNYRLMIKQSLLLMLVPLIIDFLITFLLLIPLFPDLLFITYFYFTSTFFLISFSFFWSILTPVKVVSNFQMKGNTSQISIVVSMAVVLLMTNTEIDSLHYFLIPIILFAGIFAIKFSIVKYEKKKHLIFTKIFKQ